MNSSPWTVKFHKHKGEERAREIVNEKQSKNKKKKKRENEIDELKQWKSKKD